jgi:hypothetical protein
MLILLSSYFWKWSFVILTLSGLMHSHINSEQCCESYPLGITSFCTKLYKFYLEQFLVSQINDSFVFHESKRSEISQGVDLTQEKYCWKQCRVHSLCNFPEFFTANLILHPLGSQSTMDLTLTYLHLHPTELWFIHICFPY